MKELEEERRIKARQLRYKKAISTQINADRIIDDLYAWDSECDDVEQSLYAIDRVPMSQTPS